MHRFKYLLLLPFLLLSCSEDVTIHNYHEIREHLISWNSVFEQSEDDYLVYFYSERCRHCNEIKQYVISFYLEGSCPMYFVCSDFEVVLGPKKDLKGIDNIDDFYIFGTPFLVRILLHSIESYYVGVEEVKQCISILNKK